MLELFIMEFLPSLDPETTGVILVHVLNPWGMANLRRVNQNNVDLNRNFMGKEGDFLVEFNPDYKKLENTLNPDHPLRSLLLEDFTFIKNVIQNLLRHGMKSLRGAVMLGQQGNPSGLYFSGKAYQPETLTTKKIIDTAFSSSKSVLHIDMHTGYGPRYQMTLVNSPAEVRKSEELIKDFQFPLILQADPDQFYSMQGDMIDWVYKMKESDYPDVEHFGTAFEFGCYGEGFLKEIKSIRTMIYENQAIHHGSTSIELGRKIRNEIVEMYFPKSDQWRGKALSDCRQAFRGVLTAEGYI